jgi:ElaB/YqjD/DUF883 family membrane-anchored ribosome-binding protein
METKNVKKSLTVAKKRLNSEFKKSKAKLEKAQKDVEKFIEKNPKKAVAIAAGIGASLAAGITAALIKHKKKR